jgi:hypothetical protein
MGFDSPCTASQAQLWARVEAGEVRVYLARLVARRSRDLTLEEAGYVDARLAEYADGRLTWTRFQAGLEGLVGAADSKATAEAERQAAGQQVARPTRPRDDEFGTGDHGLRGFYIKAPAATVLVFDAALQRIADILADLGDPAPVAQRRVTALLVLSRPDLAAELLAAYQAWSDRPDGPAGPPPEDPDRPTQPEARTSPPDGPKPELDWAKLLPQVVINLHTYAAPDREPGSQSIARVEGCGPVTETWIREHLAPHAKVTVKPVLGTTGR